MTCAGCIVPELLDGTNHVAWWQAGATIFDKKGIQYLGVPGLINAKSIIATLLVQVSPSSFRRIQPGVPFICPCPGMLHMAIALEPLHALTSAVSHSMAGICAALSRPS